MPQRINVPGIGWTNFPDGMTDEQIGAAIDQMKIDAQPLTLQRGAEPSAVKQANEPPPYMAIADAIAKASKGIADWGTDPENAPTIGGLFGGLAAAPFTGGMSAIPAIALAAGGAGVGGALGAGQRAMGREAAGIPQTPSGVAGDMAGQFVLQGGTQAIGGAVTRGVGAGLQTGGRALYGLGLRPEVQTLSAQFPGITRRGLTDAGIRNAVPITQEGAEQAGGLLRASAGAVDDAVAALPKGTTVPTKPIIGRTGAAKPIIQEAQNRAAGNASVKPVVKHVLNATASHGDTVTPKQLLALQRATARQTGSVTGVMPQAARPSVGRMQPNLIPEVNRAMAGAAQDTLEGIAPSIAPIQAQMPTQGALEAAIIAATQREPVSHYMIAQAGAGAGGAALGAMAGGAPGALAGGALGGAAGAAAAGLLTNPATLGNAGILTGRAGMGLAGSTGQLPANLMRMGTNAMTPPAPPTMDQMLMDMQPQATPVDPNTGFRLIPREDYWTPR